MEDLEITKELIITHRMDERGNEKSLIDIYYFCLTIQI